MTTYSFQYVNQLVLSYLQIQIICNVRIVFFQQSNEGKPKESNKGKDDSSKAAVEGVKDSKEIGEGKAEEGKSKAELKAERRAKQEAQRAAKAAATDHKPAAKPKPEVGKVKTEKPADEIVKVKITNISKLILIIKVQQGTVMYTH